MRHLTYRVQSTVLLPFLKNNVLNTGKFIAEILVSCNCVICIKPWYFIKGLSPPYPLLHGTDIYDSVYFVWLLLKNGWMIRPSEYMYICTDPLTNNLWMESNGLHSLVGLQISGSGH